MKFKNKEEIKKILKMNITDEEKRNLIANLKNHKTDIARIIVVDYELDIEEGQIWDNLGMVTSWTDRNVKIKTTGFEPETKGEIEYILFIDGKAEGYQVQYFPKGETDELDDLAFDEVYEELMKLLDSDGNIYNEAEILIPAETKFQIMEINDDREDVGYIEVILKEVK